MSVYTSLIETPKLATSNSYASVAEADDYHLSIPLDHMTDWTAATTAEKERALMMATRLLDTWIDWKGSETDADVQRLAWPRADVYAPDGEELNNDTIPQFLIEATSETARILLDKDLNKEPVRGIERLRTGDVDITFDTHRTRRVIIKAVRGMIDFYADSINDGGGGRVKIQRV